MARAGRVTATDVARAAGVSQATVSYVLNGTPNQTIPPETQQRVHDAVQALGYTPNAAARALRRGRSDSVLLVLPDWPLSTTVADLIDRLSDSLEQKGLHVLVRRLRPGQHLSTVLLEVAPAAVVALAPIDDATVASAGAAGIPVVQGLTNPTGAPASALVAPQHLTGALQVQHLAARGHRAIGYAVPDDLRLQPFFDLRLEGARRGCLDLGLPAPVVLLMALDTDAAASAVRRWRQDDPPVTAVCAFNDDYAFAILAGLRALGLQAPDDLAVIGVDNVPLAAFACPPLTTVDQNIPLTAGHLAAVVTAEIAGTTPPPAPRSDVFSVVVRDSA
jgi:DNA-binding LacI/PurR family transcriptional regulator